MPQTGTLLHFLLQTEGDDFDQLVRRLCYAMLTANSRRTRHIEDSEHTQLVVAWMSAYIALTMIHEHVRQYHFVTDTFGDPHANGGWTYNAAGQLVEQSGSMRGEPIPAERARQLAEHMLVGAERILTEFDERHPNPFGNAFLGEGFSAIGDPPVSVVLFGEATKLDADSFSLRIPDTAGHGARLRRSFGIHFEPGEIASGGEGGIPEFRPGRRFDPAAIGLQVGCAVRHVGRLDEVPDAIRQILAQARASAEGDSTSEGEK